MKTVWNPDDKDILEQAILRGVGQLATERREYRDSYVREVEIVSGLLGEIVLLEDAVKARDAKIEKLHAKLKNRRFFMRFIAKLLNDKADDDDT